MSNKIETHSKRAEIETKILSGESYQNIAEWCAKTLNFDISHMSIKRYADKTGLSKNRENNIQIGLSDDEISEITNNNAETLINIEIPKFDNETDLISLTRKTLIEVYLNQLAIVKAKQIAFMKGNGKYPQNEISGLRTIIACVGYLSEGKDKVIKNDSD